MRLKAILPYAGWPYSTFKACVARGTPWTEKPAAAYGCYARLVAQGCSVGDIQVAFPSASEREIEEAIAWAQR